MEAVYRKDHNIGIDVLKVIACYGVVHLHFGRGGGWLVCVPLFMFLAIYLSAETIIYGDGLALMRRIRRLYLPFCFWGATYWCILLMYDGRWSVCKLLAQLTIGVPANPPMYFIFLLMANTSVLWVMLRTGRLGIHLVGLLSLICIGLQYTGVNSMMCDQLPLFARFAVGRFAELFPVATVAYMVRQSGSEGLLATTSAVLLAALCLSGFTIECRGYDYQGLPMLLATLSIATFVIKVGMAIGERVPMKVKRVIIFFRCACAGVYYMHLLVGKTIEFLFGSHRGELETAVVFIASVAVVSCVRQLKPLKWCVR